MSKVRITTTRKDSDAIIGVFEANPEKGYVRVEQVATFINDEGWLNKAYRSAFIKGDVQDLADQNYEVGAELPGRIYVKESLTPFNDSDGESDLKIAGDTGVICRVDDQPIYRKTFYSANPNKADELIMHTNRDEIRDAAAASKALRRLNRVATL